MSFRVITLGLVATIKPEQGKEELELLGFHTRFIYRWLTRGLNPIRIIQVLVPRDEKRSYNIKYFMEQGVKIETRYSTGQPTQ
ncbi:hypothetical protein GWI33_022499 [Rhynchophorus ferrugineus]|uniref:Pre-C2HC domain-containing protein n=1 Tax=Rhynchophorus ferrugineus TaxID=354439 RepID=A0A834J0C7_RHYFE|nr:hypothetical protein GWI33_022499 [Rhynchophorus ferrugineus]